jgi:hypothetical protein
MIQEITVDVQKLAERPTMTRRSLQEFGITNLIGDFEAPYHNGMTKHFWMYDDKEKLWLNVVHNVSQFLYVAEFFDVDMVEFYEFVETLKQQIEFDYNLHDLARRMKINKQNNTRYQHLELTVWKD